MEHEYDGIDYHSDGFGRDAHAAINVKVYKRIDLPEAHEPFGEAAWESCAVTFWEDATELAHERGYSCVFSEGRSGGWLVPFYQTLGDGRSTFMRWPGQGGGMGYPRYPDVDDIGERSRFRAFERRIQAMLDDVPASVQAEAAYLAEQADVSLAPAVIEATA